ncbi:MAG: imidazole glycerol phosphate synthase subunit HisH [Terrimesophilobacter sp.]
MAGPSVVVLDYGSGNVHSAAKALEASGAAVELTADPGRVAAADGLVIPGVGAFASVMHALNVVRAPELIDRRLAGGRAVFGICVGMQVLFERGIERGTKTEGLGQWPGTVTALEAEVLPHIGWATVDPPEHSNLFAGIERERFYFVHSNAALEWPLPDDGNPERTRLTWATHGIRFLAAVENGPLSATQFHPEKSGPAGLRLLSNWVRSLRSD